MKKILLLIGIGIGIGIGLALWQIQSSRLHLEEQSRFMMGTYVTIQAAGPGEVVSAAIDLAFERMGEIEIKFNALNPKSPLYAFNHQGAPVRDREVLDLIYVALEVSRDSQGAFDITVGPLIKLWRFSGDSPHPPEEEEIKEALENIGYEHLVFTKEGLKADKKDVSIGLGGIAKGYAVARAAETLRAEGITSALIDAGGDIYALGRKDREQWKVGIQHPRRRGLLGYLKVSDMAVMGSGDYERFFIKEGRRYHHILDPRTGYPAEDLTSVTVIYPDAAIADAWATAFFVLGPKKTLEMVEKISDMEVVMVTSEEEILYSSGLKKILNLFPSRLSQVKGVPFES